MTSVGINCVLSIKFKYLIELYTNIRHDTTKKMSFEAQSLRDILDEESMNKTTDMQIGSDSKWRADFRIKMNERQKDWSDEKKETHVKFLKDLAMAYATLKDLIIRRIMSTVKERLSQNTDIRLITIKNWDMVDDFEAWKEHYGFHPNNLTKGFWDSRSNQYKRFSHLEAGLDRTMEEDIFAELAPFGFFIYLVDDLKQSGKTVMKVKLCEF